MPAHDMLNLITRPKLQECQSHSPISSSSHLINGYGANARTQKHRKCSRYIYNRSRLGQSRLNPNRQDCHLRTLVIVWNGHIIQKFYMERFERIPLQWPLRFQSHTLLTSLEVSLETKSRTPTIISPCHHTCPISSQAPHTSECKSHSSIRSSSHLIHGYGANAKDVAEMQ